MVTFNLEVDNPLIIFLIAFGSVKVVKCLFIFEFIQEQYDQGTQQQFIRMALRFLPKDEQLCDLFKLFLKKFDQS